MAKADPLSPIVTQLFSKQADADDGNFSYLRRWWDFHAAKVPPGRHATPLSEQLWNLAKDFLWGDNMKYSKLDPLHLAAESRLVDILDWAHPPGVDFNVRGQEYFTLLMSAMLVLDHTHHNLLKLVEVVLKKDVDVNAKNVYGMTALIWLLDNACGDEESQVVQVIRLLCAKDDCELDHVDCDGRSALGIARYRQLSSSVQLLQKKGARVAMYKWKEEPWPQ